MCRFLKHILFQDVPSPRWRRPMATRRRYPLLGGWHALVWALIGLVLMVVGVKVPLSSIPHLLIGGVPLILGLVIIIGATELS